MKNNVTNYNPFSIQDRKIYIGDIFYAFDGKSVWVRKMTSRFELDDNCIYFVKRSDAHGYANSKRRAVLIHPFNKGDKIIVLSQYMYNFHNGKTFEILEIISEANRFISYKVRQIDTNFITILPSIVCVKYSEKKYPFANIKSDILIKLCKKRNKLAIQEYVRRFKKAPKF